jgi:putative SOS response-associated peptidase YedK
MCGRFTLHHSTEDVAERFAVEQLALGLTPAYNIAPSQPIATILQRQSRTLEKFKWGLVPAWAKDPAIGNRMINARAESASEKPAFRDAIRRRRCLVPASGYYEWRRSGPVRVPMYVHMKDQRPFAMAGLWEEWAAPGGAILRSVAIVTTEPNPFAATIHHRMPAIIDVASEEAWLDPTIEDVARVTSFLKPYAGDDLQAHPVSTAVNKADCDEAACIEPVDPPKPPAEQLGLPF